MSKILFHHNCLQQGGAERVVTNLSNTLSNMGYDIIVATQWQGENEFVLDKKVRRIHVGLSAEDEKKNRISRAVIRLRNLRRLLKEEKPDVAIGFTRKPLYRLLAAALGTGIPAVIAVRTDPVGNYDKAVDKLCIPLLFPHAAGAVFQTEGQRDFFPEYIRKKSAIILNPVSDKYLNPVNVQEKENAVVHSSRLDHFKNQPMLLKAFIKVHEKHPDYVLKIYGEDSGDGTLQKLEKIINDNNAEEYIRLMGGSDSLETELPKGKIYAFSSDCEGMPNALIEAMCLGMPVISTDCPCGGPRTLIRDGSNGILVPVNDDDALADAICRLIENPQLADELGKEAALIKERVEGQRVTKQWEEYILSVEKF